MHASLHANLSHTPLSRLLSESVLSHMPRKSVHVHRFELQQALFSRFPFVGKTHPTPGFGDNIIEIPRLWCPILCHYQRNQTSNAVEINRTRVAHHLAHVLPHLGGVFINGSTGDGFDMSADLQTDMLRCVLDFYHHYDGSTNHESSVENAALHLDQTSVWKPLIIGCLHRTVDETIEAMQETMKFLHDYYGTTDLDDLFKQSPFTGFVVCPPTNTDDPKEIEKGLSAILDQRLPTIPYHLPQETQSQISGDVLYVLSERYGNLIMAKDSSYRQIWGHALQLPSYAANYNGIFLLCGGEGNYVEKMALQPYNGLVLSSANCFPFSFREVLNRLDAMTRDIGSHNTTRGSVTTPYSDSTEWYLFSLEKQKEWNTMMERSDILSRVVAETFALVNDLPFGNTFGNSARLVDHCLAYGDRVHDADVPLPMSYSGDTFSNEDVREAVRILNIAVTELSADVQKAWAKKGYLSKFTAKQSLWG